MGRLDLGVVTHISYVCGHFAKFLSRFHRIGFSSIYIDPSSLYILCTSYEALDGLRYSFFKASPLQPAPLSRQLSFGCLLKLQLLSCAEQVDG